MACLTLTMTNSIIGVRSALHFIRLLQRCGASHVARTYAAS